MGRFFVSFFFVIFFAACTSMSKSEKTAGLLSPLSIEEPKKSEFFSIGNWPSLNWWEVFDSPELNSLVDIALVSNPSIQAIEEKTLLFKQDTIIARSRLFPLLFFDANESWQYVSQNGLLHTLNPTLPLNSNLVDLSLSFNYEVDFWGKYRNLFHAALGRQKAEEAEKAQVTLLVTSALSQAYFALKTNLCRKKLYERLAMIQEDLFFLQGRLQKSALISKLPLLLSEENLEEAYKIVYQIEEEVLASCHLINSLIGKSPDSPLDVKPEIPPFPKTLALPENISLDLLSRRPDLMASIWRVEAEAHDTGAAIADFYPNVNLKGLIGLQSFGFDKLFLGSSKETGLYPAIHLPIFTAGAIRANVDKHKALFHAALFEYNKLLLESAKEVADYLVFSEKIFEKRKSEEVIVRSAKERFDISFLRYEMGLDNRLEALNFEADFVQKQIDSIELLYNQYLAAVKLIKALGGGYTSEYVPLRKEE